MGETVWGVVTWQDVDPNNVWFSVYVEGRRTPTSFPTTRPSMLPPRAQGQFREIRTKVLKINFWRPGDEYTVKDSQVRSGVPELPGGPPLKPSYEWVWWKTFPPTEKALPPN